jgi:hypothetical protein
MRRLTVALALAAAMPGLLEAQTDEQLRRAVTLYEGLEIPRARDLFLQVISPGNPLAVTEAQRVIAYKYLGASYAVLGQQDSAIAFFLGALQRDPLTDLDPRSFAETERSVFNAAKGRIFRLGVRPLPARPDTIDPRSTDPARGRRNLGIATTHDGAVLLELVHTEVDLRYSLFEGTVDGPRDVPFNGITPRGLIEPGTYELVLIGRSNRDTLQRDSTSAVVLIEHLREPYEDTLADLSSNQLLPDRAPASVAVRDLLRGLAVGGVAIASSTFLGRQVLEETPTLSVSVGLLGIGAGVWAYLHRRSHPEIPENIRENENRRRLRAEQNTAIMQRNEAKRAATRLVVRPLTATQ